MVSPTTDRRQGLVGNTAIKAPVTVLAASNITLSGQQTIDGVAVLATNAAGVPDRVLCIGQTDTTQNGIWDVSTGSWSRSLDANGNYDFTQGTTVLVALGTNYSGSYWKIDTSGRIIIGITSLAWSRALANASSAQSFLEAGTGALTISSQDKMREQPGVTGFGVDKTGASSVTTALQAAIDAVSAAGGGDLVISAGTYRLNAQVTVKTGVRLRVSQYATFIHGANAKLFRMKPRSRFEGGKVDVSSTTLANFSSTVFEFDGTDTAPNFRGVEPTVVRTEVVGRRGVGTGKAFHLHATGATSNVYGVEVDSTIDGFEIGVHLENDDSGAGTRWVNGNTFKLRGIATVNLVKQTTGTDGRGIDGNLFQFDYQYISPYTDTVFTVVGRYNHFVGMVWDYAAANPIISFSALAARNAFLLHGVDDTKFSESGGNIGFFFTDANPSLKISRIMPVTPVGGTLIVDTNDVLMSNNKSLQWKDSGGTTRTVLQLTAIDNVSLSTPPGAGSLILAGFTRVALQVNGADKARFDGNAIANETSLLLWDVTAGALVRVSRGAADSGGAGFRLLRVPN